jgi:hypothetical protein
MINKNYDLLGEQLAESGLEMNIVIGAGAIIGGVASIASGIFGSSQADAQNREAKKAQKKAEEAAQEAADATNEYNKRSFKVDKQNYANTRAFEAETLTRNWQYQTEQQDFGYLSAIEQYGKSVQNTQDRLTYNSIAAMQAYESEQSALNDLFTEDAFSRQGMLVDQLQNEGKAALGQAGNSRTKALQSSIAALGRNSAIMDASLSSSVEQSQRNMQQIGLQRYAADLQTNASMMIKPKKAPAIPLPMQAPERIFIEPMEVLPQAIQPARQQSTFAPILSGFISGAGQIAGGFASQSNYQSPFGQIGSTGGSFGGTNLGIGSSSGFNLNANYGGF